MSVVDEEQLLAELREECEDHFERIEREHRYGPVADEAEFVSERVRRTYEEMEPFNA